MARYVQRKLNYDVAQEIRERHADGATQVALASEFGVSNAAIGQIVNGKTWALPPRTDDEIRFSRSQLEQQRNRRLALADPDFWRKRHFQARYGLTLEQLREMLSSQDGKCAACGEPMVLGDNVHVDHCHRTGRVRALLCRGCNQALGILQEDPKRIRALARYAEVWTRNFN